MHRTVACCVPLPVGQLSQHSSGMTGFVTFSSWCPVQDVPGSDGTSPPATNQVASATHVSIETDGAWNRFSYGEIRIKFGGFAQVRQTWTWFGAMASLVPWCDGRNLRQAEDQRYFGVTRVPPVDLNLKISAEWRLRSIQIPNCWVPVRRPSQ